MENIKGFWVAKFELSQIPTKKKSMKIKPLRTSKSLEKELENFMKFMVTSTKNRFKSKVLKAMNKSTVKKFADAQKGSYSTIYLKLVKEFQRSINLQFNEKRIKKYIQKLYKQNNSMNDKQFYKSLESGIGLDIKSIIKTDGTNTFVNAKSLETTGQIIKFQNESILNYTQNVQRLMGAGKSLDTLYEEVENQSGKNKNKSEIVSRNELKTFNSQLSDKRAENVGITKAIWRAVIDERSRPCHKVRDGMEYDIAKGLYSSCDGKTIKAGEEINCRCFAEYIVEFD